MTSLVRPSVFRHACTAASSKRLFASHKSAIAVAALPALHGSKSTQLRPFIIKQTSVRGVLSGSTKVAAFHASSRRAILPPLPERIDGTVNDPAPVPPPSSIHGAYHWTFERVVSVAITPLTIAPFMGTSLNPVTDAALCALLIAHSHIGFQACITDYFPKQRVPKTRAALEWALRIATLLTAVGLYEFETNDVGLTEAIKRIWKA